MTRQGGWPSTGFAGRLREERERAGLSQRQLAERVGCHYMTISMLERGTQEPAWPLVLAIADALGLTCEALRGTAEPTVKSSAKEPPRPRGRARRTPPAPASPPPAPKKGRKRKRG
jgi:transcriptional regulator with XRE-family HTH domain